MRIAYMKMDAEGVLTELQDAPDPEPEPTIVAEHRHENGTLVSTAFTAVCMCSEDGVPQCFETVVVRGHKSTVVARYGDLNEALHGHERAVAGSS